MFFVEFVGSWRDPIAACRDESRMSLWYFLTDWFAAVPTRGALFKRSMINGACALAIIFVMMLLQVRAEYAAVVFFGVFVVNGAMAVVYQRQRDRDRTSG